MNRGPLAYAEQVRKKGLSVCALLFQGSESPFGAQSLLSFAHGSCDRCPIWEHPVSATPQDSSDSGGGLTMIDRVEARS
jgi:hypothetical protein